MTPEQLAGLHARCFTTPRPWTAEEFDTIQAMQGCFLLTVADGFLLGRVIAGEGELLTLAVAPEARRQGTGRKLTQEFMNHARKRGAEELFLEVAALNQPAKSLYTSLGWQEAGRRRGYYGPNQDAIIMRYECAPE